MPDYVLKSPSQAAFLQAAEGLGYVRRDANGQNPTLVTVGRTSDGGNYFINVVGVVSAPTGKTLTVTGDNGSAEQVPEMAPIDGFWARIRVNNGGVLPTVPPGFTLYPPPELDADGNPVDPNYVQPPYGMIA